MKINCNVIRDLLPLYEDGAVSEDTAQLVREHLEHCPACREELRKMRVPISLPPDEDEEAVKRFLEHRAELRRAQNKKLICVLVPLALVLVAVVLFCLWYTRPRSWTELAGSDEVDAIIGSLTEYNFHPSEDWETTPPWDFWRLDESDVDAEALGLILYTLKESSYRADLGNLRNYTPFPRTGLHGKGMDTIHLTLLTQQRSQYISFSLDSGGQVTIYTSLDSRDGIFAYQADEDLHQLLSGLIRQYGTLEPADDLNTP